ATVPGVGLIVAAAYVCVIDDPHRFQSAHALASYLGLVPAESSSGGSDRKQLGHITRHGNAMLRALLVQAAQAFMNSTSVHDPMWMWSRQMLLRRPRNVVAIAVARRISGVLFALWRDGTAYDPAALAQESAVG